ncbi:MAG: hypothetical protein KJ645_05715, partial [Planctomycetes bacterium]|nr:hypothetical protein [Planctomycetota bacterium]
CKNSWGGGWGNNGYFWISYYDKHCCQHPEMGAISYEEVEPFDYAQVYYHDYHGWRDTKTDSTEGFNAFVCRAADERLKSVSFYTAADNVAYTIRIYDRFQGGQLLDLLAEQSGVIDARGFHTKDLDDRILLTYGDDFYVYLYLSAGGHPFDCTSEVPVLLGAKSRVTVESSAQPGQSFYKEGGSWIDLTSYDDTANLCIKALTVIEPAVNIFFPQGLPEAVRPIGVSTPVVVEMAAGLENYVPGSGRLLYRAQKSGPFQAYSLTPLGGDLYEALLPATVPGDEPEFYFTATGDGGHAASSPKNAPLETHGFEIFLTELVMEDDFETDQGWTVYNLAVTDGGWERGAPQETTAQPGADHSENGTICFVTGKAGGTASSDDLDGGPAGIVSPSFDLSQGDALVSFYVWFNHSTSGEQRPLKVYILNYAMPFEVFSLLHCPQWTHVSFRVSDFVTPSSSIRISIEAADNPDDSVVEALVDDFRVEYIHYEPALWADRYTIDTTGATQVGLDLKAGPEQAGRTYLVLGSVSGTLPGFELPGGVHASLNWDAFTELLLGLLGTPVCQDFYGTLDGEGTAHALLNTLAPMDPLLIGYTLYLTYVLAAPPALDFVSNPIALSFE